MRDAITELFAQLNLNLRKISKMNVMHGLINSIMHCMFMQYLHLYFFLNVFDALNTRYKKQNKTFQEIFIILIKKNQLYCNISNF